MLSARKVLCKYRVLCAREFGGCCLKVSTSAAFQGFPKPSVRVSAHLSETGPVLCLPASWKPTPLLVCFSDLPSLRYKRSFPHRLCPLHWLILSSIQTCSSNSHLYKNLSLTLFHFTTHFSALVHVGTSGKIGLGMTSSLLHLS